jgi:hypothetical protein
VAQGGRRGGATAAGVGLLVADCHGLTPG